MYRYNSVLNVVNLLNVPIILAGLKEFKLERIFSYIFNVVNFWHMTVTLNGMKEHILERSHMNVISVILPNKSLD